MMAGEVVGYLEIRMAGENVHATHNSIDIHGNEQFYLGRNPALCERHWPDPTISSRHIRIHCVIYDASDPGGIPPLVYATDVSSNGTFLTKANVTSSDTQGVLMTRKHGAFLLADGDELRISGSVTLVYHDMGPKPDCPLTHTQQDEVTQFASRYLITDRLLGKGGFGKVVVGIHQKSQRQLACKVINLREFYSHGVLPDLILPTGDATQRSTAGTSRKRWPSKVTRCSREFLILKQLSHPNIISVEKVFWSPSTIYLFQELIAGGDLFSYMERKGHGLSSVEAAVIVLQILKAVDYLHDRDIVHRDLKPDNILLTYPEDGARIVITDFGNARVLPDATKDGRRRMYTKTGTIDYLAPEIHEMNKTIPKGYGYSKAVDMWSIGVVTATMLSNQALFAAPPFEVDAQRYVLQLAAKCDISIIDDDTHPAWSKVSERPKDFVKNLLVLEEGDRMTVKQALAHPWFTNPYLVEEFDALYLRSIRDWQPRQTHSKLIESLAVHSPTDGVASQKQFPCFQQPFAQVSAQNTQGHFTGSQDWDLGVNYPPPSDEESIAAEHEEAQYEEPSRCDQYSFELGIQPGYDQTSGPVDESTNQLSLQDDLQVSDMHATHATASDSHKHLGDNSERNPTQGSPDAGTVKPISISSSSIVYETPIRDSQLQGLAYYTDIFRGNEADAQEQLVNSSHKRRKLTQVTQL